MRVVAGSTAVVPILWGGQIRFFGIGHRCFVVYDFALPFENVGFTKDI